MKKQIAIFALGIFFFAQFGKVIDFCFCTMAAFQQTKTFTCDCEKQLYTAVATDHAAKNHNPQNISSVHQWNELFHFSPIAVFTVVYTICITDWPRATSTALYNKFDSNIFHPPLLLC
ncbi:MAG: hypothetical protein ABIQ88_19130 [Chitinophagaceae bacterium]